MTERRNGWLVSLLRTEWGCLKGKVTGHQCWKDKESGGLMAHGGAARPGGQGDDSGRPKLGIPSL